MSKTDPLVKGLISLRHQLHQHPELSGQEYHTPEIILDFLSDHKPDKVIRKLGGHGMALVYESGKPGPAVMFRCELDALPIQETNNFEHRSRKEGVSHKCGHDGHMTIVTGLAQVLAENRPVKGKVILLYQPAEETGEGAAAILKDPLFKKIIPDYVIGVHNLPGFRKGAAVIKPGVFASASTGMIIQLQGATSHAAEPEHGKSPALALAAIIQGLTALPKQENSYNGLVLVTVVHALLGEIAFGTTPGYAELRATLRGYEERDLKKMCQKAIDLVKDQAKKYDLKATIRWTEEFPETRNDAELTGAVRHAALQADVAVAETDKPFRWSEDFGAFGKEFPICFFGLGAGEDSRELHHEDYDFPDDIISNGVRLLHVISRNLLQEVKSG